MLQSYVIYTAAIAPEYRIFLIDKSWDETCIDQKIVDIEAQYFDRPGYMPGSNAYLIIEAPNPETAFEMAVDYGFSEWSSMFVKQIRAKHPEFSMTEAVKKSIEFDRQEKEREEKAYEEEQYAFPEGDDVLVEKTPLQKQITPMAERFADTLFQVMREKVFTYSYIDPERGPDNDFATPSF